LSDESRKILVRKEIHEKLLESLSASGASSVDELAGRILRDWLSARGTSTRRTGSKRVSKADEETMEERLKALGYI
jgi:hypothetical protein